MASTTEHKGAVEDEDTGAHITPIVKLDEVAVTTGDEDDDDPLFDPKAKLYRFDKDGTSGSNYGLDLVLIPETTFVGVESRVLIPETTFVGVESRVLIPETTFVGVESRVLIPETTVWDTLVYPSDTLVILRTKNIFIFLTTYMMVDEVCSESGGVEQKGSGVLVPGGNDELGGDEVVTET
ncbi:Ran-binding protein 1 homolog b-like protein [Tanacetum coccineum]